MTAKRPMTPARWRTIEMLAEKNRKPVRDRFERRLAPPSTSGCVEWQGFRDRNGYGRLGRRAAAHIALEISGRLRPSKDHFACHTCDNPPCVNPDHLWWGTHSENMKDCFNKGRAHIDGLRHGWKYGRGEIYPWSKIGVGQSFFWPGNVRKLTAAAHAHGKNNGRKYRTAKESGGGRCWRLA